MINISNLTKKYGKNLAVDDLSFNIRDGEIFGLLGPNGAGKTTTIRLLCCLIAKTSGSVIINDLDTDKKSDQIKIRKLLGLLPENVGLYEDLTVYKNLNFFGRLYKTSLQHRKEQIEFYLKNLDIWDKRNTTAGTLSKGMKQKVAIARALIHDPPIIFLDEPTANLDPESSKTVRNFIIELKNEDRTIVLNTHLLDEANKICDRVGILKTQLIAIDSPTNLKKQLWNRKTIIQLEKINEKIISALQQANYSNIESLSNKLLIEVSDPEKENPKIIDTIISVGGKIQFVTEFNPSLEEIYLKLIKEGIEDGF